VNTTVSEGIRKTVLVDFPPEQAFDLFTRRIAKWWPVHSHSYGGDEVTNVVFELEVGGRVYEVTDKGEQDWGRVLELEPPNRFLLEWLIGEACGTAVEVTFAPEGPGSRVLLEHRGFGASDPRDRYSSGWEFVLGRFASESRKA
jgi:uncharacterized protein YndB with AHSA1/START domain